MEVSGSIFRGLSIGTSQDVVMNAGMNLQLQGDLGGGVKFEGAITDKTMPFQPQGNTLRVEEFDRAYLRAYSKSFELQAGDIKLSPFRKGLITYQRNVQGISYYHKGEVKAVEDTITTRVLAAVAKGKFTQNRFNGIERNQGPYKLKGAEGEVYIVVIAGSEKVFVDGKLLTRGETNHYVIDYNTAEITFMPRITITSNSRIVIEFEYTERNYARYLISTDIEQTLGNYKFRVSAFSENDIKSQPLGNNLSQQQIELLQSIGDNIQGATSLQVDSVGYNPDKLLYAKQDTFVNGTTYQIYIYNTNPLKAHFQVMFTYMGEGRGSYMPQYGNANGKVFVWIAPENGIKKGSYEPVIQLITPKKRQMASLEISRSLGNRDNFSAEVAVSRYDINTFSSLDYHDDFGSAISINYLKNFRKDSLKETWLGLKGLITSRNFTSIDRIRSVEFERDWNIKTLTTGSNEKEIALDYGYRNEGFKINGISKSLSLQDGYWGLRNNVITSINSRYVKSNLDISYLTTKDTANKTSFLRMRLNSDFLILNRTMAGLIFEMEDNTYRDNSNSRLLPQSYKWYHTNFVIGTRDSVKRSVRINYSLRTDYRAVDDSLMNKYSFAQDFGLKMNILNDAGNRLNINLAYRIFEPFDSLLSKSSGKENSLIGRFDYSYISPGRAISTNFSYELGNGLEPKYYYYYIEVPAGQGVFKWIDYNSNGVKELDEFEVAEFKDEATYIRINLPSDNYITVNTNALNIQIDFSPENLKIDSSLLLRMFSRITNRFSLGTRQKNQFDHFFSAANPVETNLYDTMVTGVSRNMINSLAYNRFSRIFGLEWLTNQSVNKQVLVNGFEVVKLRNHELICHVGFSSSLSMQSKIVFETKTQKSEYFTSRNYSIRKESPSLSLRHRSKSGFTFETGYEYENARNTQSDEHMKNHRATFDVIAGLRNQTWISINSSIMIIDYSGESETQLGYELLKGFKPGRNATWGINLRKKISNYFELEFSYQGRYISDNNVVHTGSMQLRALF